MRKGAKRKEYNFSENQQTICGVNSVFQTALTSGEKTGSVTDIIPQSLGIWDFDVTLKKESSDWKVTSAKWKQAEMMKTDE